MINKKTVQVYKVIMDSEIKYLEALLKYKQKEKKEFIKKITYEI